MEQLGLRKQLPDGTRLTDSLGMMGQVWLVFASPNTPVESIQPSSRCVCKHVSAPGEHCHACVLCIALSSAQKQDGAGVLKDSLLPSTSRENLILSSGPLRCTMLNAQVCSLRAGAVARSGEGLYSNHKALSSSPNTYSWTWHMFGISAFP